ncbi:hypothetical protein E2C01_023672 [Portunus trituberculatus]|uniref:Uncharacterized protein n=1 Tax=Portunus trituberculatus TaxID=210409 RepID=A0A5B7E9Q4_PORTR|nr:hypothetical protein [Portunus trituberculatus]
MHLSIHPSIQPSYIRQLIRVHSGQTRADQTPRRARPIPVWRHLLLTNGNTERRVKGMNVIVFNQTLGNFGSFLPTVGQQDAFWSLAGAGGQARSVGQAADRRSYEGS